MISVYNNKQNCCGCTACKFSCPTSAIEMVEDNEGFLYPIIEQNSCIDCGRCRSVCSFNNNYLKNNDFELPIVLAVKHKNNDIRMSSTSGGVFTALSDYILDNSGVVFGAKFDENKKVIHSKAFTKLERDKFNGSKYVQSDLNDVFKDIKNLIRKNKKVLFSGTPCQCAGLRSFLTNENVENLVICDIVCHGVPSPLMFKEHIKRLELVKNSVISNYFFRDKILGWHAHNEVAVFKNGKKEFLTSNMERHKLLFHSHFIMRPSCYECVFTNLNRPSDITMGDFWGIERSMPDFDDNKGVSLILINSLKGKSLFEKIKDKLEYRISNIDDCMQPNLKQPTTKPKNRDEFWNDYFEKGYKFVIKKYIGLNKKKQLRYFVKKIIYSIGMYDLYNRYISRK
jgi:coenzyme F420-reducing hydrogenase beta subunit